MSLHLKYLYATPLLEQRMPPPSYRLRGMYYDLVGAFTQIFLCWPSHAAGLSPVFFKICNLTDIP